MMIKYVCLCVRFIVAALPLETTLARCCCWPSVSVPKNNLRHQHRIQQACRDMDNGVGDDDNDEFLFVQTKNKHRPAAAAAAAGQDLIQLVDTDDDNGDNWIEGLNDGWLETATPPNIPLETALKLKQILLGSGTQAIPDEWRYQRFEFHSEIWYGLVQHRGGPCGILAAVQAYLLAQFFFRRAQDEGSDQSNHDERHRIECLSVALAEILWQIGSDRRQAVLATVDVSSPRSAAVEESTHFRFDGITEHLRIQRLDSIRQLEQALLYHLLPRRQSCFGCIAFVYSCILTRGLDRITGDPDPGSIGSLLTPATWLCTQELVNLCLMGRAVSNVFDGHVECDQVVLRGIPHRSTVGFLSWHEFQGGGSPVGTHYKNPKLPIFVVLCDGHFTVLFSKCPAPPFSRVFHYDGMAGAQDQECWWTIIEEEDEEEDQNQKTESNLTALECVLKLKWPGCRIHRQQ